MSDSVRFTVPLVPPSVNHYVKHTRRGRHYVTKEGKAFKEAVGIFGRGQAVGPGASRISIAVFLGKGQKGDVDNFAKCCLDGLVEARIIESDATVEELKIRKARDWENPRTEIEVRAIQEV